MKEVLLKKTIKVLENYLSTVDTSDESNLVKEVLIRLKRMDNIYQEVVNINNDLLENDPHMANMRTILDESKMKGILFEAAKTDNKLAEWLKNNGGNFKLRSSSEVAAYDLSDSSLSPDLRIDEIEKLHSKTEQIYHELWAVVLRLRKVPQFGKNFSPKGVTGVRNHLIEHVTDKDSGATIFSFGVSTGGPVLRPIKPIGVPAPHDNGLIANMEEFLSSVLTKLNSKNNS